MYTSEAACGETPRSPGLFEKRIMPIRSRAKRVCHHGPTNTFTVATPIGDLGIVSCPKGIHGITQSPELSDDDFHPDLEWVLVYKMSEFVSSVYSLLIAVHTFFFQLTGTDWSKIVEMWP